MNTFPVPFKIVATVLLTGLLVIVGVVNLRDRAAWADPSDGVFWVESDGGLKAEAVSPGGPAQSAGITSGDLLVSVEGQPIANLGQYYDLLERVGIDGFITYGITSGAGEPHIVRLQLTGKPLLAGKDYLRALLAFLYLGIGLFVTLRGVGLPRAFHFYAICVAAFVVFLFSWTPRLDAFDFLVYGLSLTAFLLLPALFAHFCMRFPVESHPRRSRAPWLYVPAVFLCVVQFLWLTRHLSRFGLPTNAHSSAILDRVHLLYFCGGFVLGGITLLKRRSQARDLVSRQQMKWVSYGTLAAVLPFSFIYLIPWMMGVRPNVAMESSLLFLGLIPLSFAYAVTRYRLLDVEHIVRRGLAYFSASSLLLALYLFFVLIVGRWLQLVAPEANFILVCLSVLAIALLFAPLRNSIQQWLDRSFYKERFDSRASLLDFARTLNSQISLAPLSRSILERIEKSFQLDCVALFLSDPVHNGFYRLNDSVGVQVPDGDSRLYREDDLVDPLAGDSFAEHGQSLHPATPSLRMLGVHYLQDLRLRGRRIGMVGIGQFSPDKHLSTEDMDLLDALAGYAAIALENANLYRSIESKAHELERLKIYTENIIESINVAVLALDLTGGVTSCNRAFEELYGVRRSEIVGTRVTELFPRDVVASIRKACGANSWELRTSANIFKLYLKSRRDEDLIVNLSIIPLLDSMDLNSGCLFVMDDVTAKVQLQDQLLQAEKLSSIGLLAAGIAHEVNTPITGISSYTQMLLKDTPETDTRKPILEKIERQSFRAAEIVNGLLNFARMNGSEFKDLDINELIQDSLSLLEHQLESGAIRVHTDLAPKLPAVYGNAGKLQQVLINLFLNARDAMSSGGDLNIETSMNESMVILDVRDTGAGISEENIKRIYDPFFSTKSTGKGTGLGLAVSYGIIQEHGGRIFVDSTPGSGSHFRLKLPTRHLNKNES